MGDSHSPMNFSPISASTSPVSSSNGLGGHSHNGFPYFHEPGMLSSNIQNLITSPGLLQSPNLNPISPFTGGCGPSSSTTTSNSSPFSYLNINAAHGHGGKLENHNHSINGPGHHNYNGTGTTATGGGNYGYLTSPAATVTAPTSGGNVWMGHQSNYLPCYLTGEISPGKKEILTGLGLYNNSISGGSGSGQKKSPSPTNSSPNNANGNPRDSFLFLTPQSSHQKPNFVRRVTFDEGSPNESTPKGPPKTGMGYLQSNDESPPSVFLEASANAGNRLINSSMGFTPIKETPRSRNVVTVGQWVTIFGFPSAATSFVITTFSSVGTIVETRANPGSNWIHIKFSSKLEARKSLAKNGTILAGTTMIGVVQCQDPDQNFGSEVNDDSVFSIGPTNSSHNIFSPESKNHISNPANPSNRNILGELSSSNSQFNSSTSTSANNRYFDQNGHLNGSVNHGNLKSKIRPLANGNANELNLENLPRESTGFFTNILEYMFGW